jgi:hypothetical protein
MAADDPTYGGWAPSPYGSEEAAERISLLVAEKLKEDAAAAERAAAASSAAASAAAGTTAGQPGTSRTTSNEPAPPAGDGPSPPPASASSSTTTASAPLEDSLAIVVTAGGASSTAADDDNDAAVRAAAKEAKRKANQEKRAAAEARNLAQKQQKAARSSGDTHSDGGDADLSVAHRLFETEEPEFENAPPTSAPSSNEEMSLTSLLAAAPPAPGGKVFLFTMAVTLETSVDDVRAAAHPHLVRLGVLPQGSPVASRRVRVREMDYNGKVTRPFNDGIVLGDVYTTYMSDLKKFAVEVVAEEERLSLPVQVPQTHVYHGYKPPKTQGVLVNVQWFDRARWTLGKRREVFVTIEQDSPADVWMRIQALRGLAHARHATLQAIRNAQERASAEEAPLPFVVPRPPAPPAAPSSSSLPPPPPPPPSVPSVPVSASSAASTDDDASAAATGSDVNSPPVIAEADAPPSSAAAPPAPPPVFLGPVPPATPADNMTDWIGKVQYAFVLTNRDVPELGVLPMELTWRSVSEDRRTFKEIFYGQADWVGGGTMILWDLGVPLMERTKAEKSRMLGASRESWSGGGGGGGSSTSGSRAPYSSSSSSSSSSYGGGWSRRETALKITVKGRDGKPTNAPPSSLSISGGGGGGLPSTSSSNGATSSARRRGSRTLDGDNEDGDDFESRRGHAPVRPSSTSNAVGGGSSAVMPSGSSAVSRSFSHANPLHRLLLRRQGGENKNKESHAQPRPETEDERRQLEAALDTSTDRMPAGAMDDFFDAFSAP